MAKYLLSDLARKDLIRIYQYGLIRFGVIQADKYFNEFFYYFDIIARSPHSFEQVDYIRLGYRRCVCGVDSILYRVNDGTVEIMAIVGRQDLDKLFEGG